MNRTAYVYEDEFGDPVRKVEWIEHPDGTAEFRHFCHTDSGWKRGTAGVPDVPYRLPEVMSAIDRDEDVLIVEGEDLVEALVAEDLVATTNLGGAGKWPEPFRKYFDGAHVVLLPNHDAKGQVHMDEIAHNLAPVVASLRVVSLPDLGEGENGLDWLERGGDRRQLLKLVNAAVDVGGQDEEDTDLPVDWDPPRPLDPVAKPPPFPVTALPPLLAQYVEAVSNATQTPIDLAGVLSLGLVASITSGLRIQVRKGFEVPANLYAVIAVAVGEGKSPVYREMMRSLEVIEQRLQDAAAPLIRKARARKEVALANLVAVQKKIKSLKTLPEDRAALLPDLEEAQAAFDAIVVPARPRIYTQEATPEGLLRLLSEQGGRMAALDDEGGELFELLVRYSHSGNANQGVYLRGHDGGRKTSDWSTKDSIDIESILLTLGLTVQPGVIQNLASDPALRKRGLLARIMYSLPGSNVGYRDQWADPVPEDLRDQITERLWQLTQFVRSGEPGPRPVIRLGPRATELIREWSIKHEIRLRPDGDLAAIKDWGNKLPGELARLIGILHAFSNPEEPTAKAVAAPTVERAIELADYFAEHAKAAFQVMAPDPLITKALRVVKSLRGKTTVTQREIQRSHFKNVAQTEEVVDLLVDYGYLRPQPSKSTRVGGRPSGRFFVNPLSP